MFKFKFVFFFLFFLLFVNETQVEADELKQAIQANDIEAVKSIIAAWPATHKYMNVDDEYNDAAIASGNPVIQRLVLNRQSSAGETPLIVSILSHNFERTKKLLDHGADPIQKGPISKPAIYWSIWEGEKGLKIRQLIFTHRNTKGDTPLIAAIKEKDTELVKVIVTAWASTFEYMNVDDEYNDAAIASGNPVIQRLVLNRQSSAGETPLIVSILSNNFDRTKKLLHHGADSIQNGPVSNSKPAIYWSIWAGEKGLKVRHLIFTHRNANGDTPLTVAIKEKDKELVKVIVAAWPATFDSIHNNGENEAAAASEDMEIKHLVLGRSYSPHSFSQIAEQAGLNPKASKAMDIKHPPTDAQGFDLTTGIHPHLGVDKNLMLPDATARAQLGEFRSRTFVNTYAFRDERYNQWELYPRGYETNKRVRSPYQQRPTAPFFHMYHMNRSLINKQMVLEDQPKFIAFFPLASLAYVPDEVKVALQPYLKDLQTVEVAFVPQRRLDYCTDLAILNAMREADAEENAKANLPPPGPVGSIQIKAHSWVRPDIPLTFKGVYFQDNLQMGLFAASIPAASVSGSGKQDPRVGLMTPIGVSIHDNTLSGNAGNLFTPTPLAENGPHCFFSTYSLVVYPAEHRAIVTLHWILEPEVVYAQLLTYFSSLPDAQKDIEHLIDYARAHMADNKPHAPLQQIPRRGVEQLERLSGFVH